MSGLSVLAHRPPGLLKWGLPVNSQQYIRIKGEYATPLKRHARIFCRRPVTLPFRGERSSTPDPPQGQNQAPTARLVQAPVLGLRGLRRSNTTCS